MASPILVNTVATLIVNKNKNRKNIIFQNTGTEPILMKKQIVGGTESTLSLTNYDFVLAPGVFEDDGSGTIIQIETISAFYAMTASGTSKLAIMETVKKKTGSCKNNM